jgi:chitin synthase
MLSRGLLLQIPGWFLSHNVVDGLTGLIRLVLGLLSTVHNLLELVLLKDMCGFCCFSMRFIVFIDLFGTLILPATVVYLGYLIYLVASGSGQFPLIAIVMLAAIYGLQAIVFILKRRWQHIGWMIVYLLAYPIYGFALPVYSFWHMDDFNWGNTRVVVGEKGGKKFIASAEDEKFEDSMIPMKNWEQHAQEKGLPLGPKVEIIDPSASLHAEAYPVPQSIANWQQAGRYSYMPPSSHGSSYVGPVSQVGAGSQVTGSQVGVRVMGSHYGTPSMVYQSGVPTAWPPPPGEMVEMADFANGTRVTMIQPQINAPVYFPRAPMTPSLPPSRHGSEVGGYAPSFVQGLGTEFLAYDTHVREEDESLAREIVRQVLKEVDINTTTTKQVRALVESRLGWGVNGPVSTERRKALDDMIDRELEEIV